MIRIELSVRRPVHGMWYKTEFEKYEQMYLFRYYGEDRRCQCGGKFIGQMQDGVIGNYWSIKCEKDVGWNMGNPHEYVSDGKICNYNFEWRNMSPLTAKKPPTHFEIVLNGKSWGF